MARRHRRPLNGILLLDKPVGISSNKALQQTRFLFEAEKAGHTGSLDPLASGMLPICFGEATKLSAFLLDAHKSYVTTARLGFTSTTGDAEGELQPAGTVPPLSLSLLESALAPFRGEISQVPPMYSALKQDGQPLYRLARAGIAVERKARTVTIHELVLEGFTADSLMLTVQCSKGTYIRTLVEDIGLALGCGAYVVRLAREWVNPFQALPMHAPEVLQAAYEQGGLAALDALLLPMDAALPHLQAVTLESALMLRFRQGQKLGRTVLEGYPVQIGDLVRVYGPEQQFLGLAEVLDRGLAPRRVLG
ncbi:MAG: tRNA pseudouridine(55) synthase TruB [Thiothrix sp.]|nr:tRNA pseudouridine(55) synthase TruB [Thiothrix sp.]HPE60122.1 tRNA pseudouridine(55) synthase TruB [Thiolinea sp.]